MFDDLIEETRQNINTIRSIIYTNENFRNIIFTEDTFRQPLKENSQFADLVKNTPNKIDWKVYDHCATVTRLYAIYERFVEDIISEWLGILPKLVSNYSELEDRIKNTHREGIGRLLLDLNKSRFQDLSLEKVVQSLYSEITNSNQYELLPDAFLISDQNLRKNELEKLLANAGIKKGWDWINKHRKIQYFIEEILGYQSTAEAELKKLVNYRNDAAHGGVGIDQILGTQELLDLTNFVNALCEALVELVSYHVICQKEIIGTAKKIGQIKEWYPEPEAAVATINNITVSVGDQIWLVSEKNSYCQLAKIESLKLDDICKPKISIDSETEVGFKFDTNAKEGLSLYVIE